MKYFCWWIFFSLFFLSCSMLVMDGAALEEEGTSILVVVDRSIAPSLSSSMDIYREDLENEGFHVEVLEWEGSASSLRNELKGRADGSWSAFFIGDIPWVNYEMDVFESYEVFPSDLYYSAPTSLWEDQDGNGIYDSHSFLTVLVPVSRIKGSVTEITNYFEKLHDFRTGALLFRNEALLFKDDDWENYKKGSNFAMDSIFSTVIRIENLSDSLKPVYQDGIYKDYKYVYQWIHSKPYSLYIQEGSQYRTISLRNIQDNPVQSGFFNLFNCKAARFTSQNIAMTYLTGTDSGLAVMGSSKVGGNYEPLEFHRSLSAGKSWGRSYMNWYNQTGAFDDSWYMGMVILGDPALILQPAGGRSLRSAGSLENLIPPTEKEKELMLREIQEFDHLFGEQQ